MTNIEWTIYIPLAILIVCCILQVGLFFYGRTAALAAANDGAAAAAAGSSISACEQTAMETAKLAGKAISVSEVSCRASETEVQVTLKGKGPSLIPGWKPEISVTVRKPIDRIIE
ncbi:MAG: hypothetical protein LBR20_06585 [Propionibacteriaceae bacterium]|nr:hypothetical protein [Propionibacteriaceae bacterium]